jgi:hypothetical protein
VKDDGGAVGLTESPAALFRDGWLVDQRWHTSSMSLKLRSIVLRHLLTFAIMNNVLAYKKPSYGM